MGGLIFFSTALREIPPGFEGVALGKYFEKDMGLFLIRILEREALV